MGSLGLAAVAFAVLVAAPACAGNAVRHQGSVFVRLSDLFSPDFLNGHVSLSANGRDLQVTTTVARWTFPNGGDSIVRDNGRTMLMQWPLLVLDGGCYLHVKECARHFRLRFDQDSDVLSALDGRQIHLEIRELTPPSPFLRVKNLKATHISARLSGALPAMKQMCPDAKPEVLATGTLLLARRDVRINGRSFRLVTLNNQDLETRLVEREAFDRVAQSCLFGGTYLGRLRKTLLGLAANSKGIDYGPPTELPRGVALTADMCWSLRPFERQFFESLPSLAASRRGQVWVTLFLTGRWMQQHPIEMAWFIRQADKEGVGFVWGLHSWVHPKQMPFMNAYSVSELRKDVLRNEADLLMWGVLPSVFYRFPGLIHNEARLRAIIGMDLAPVDCDSWIAGSRQNRPPHWLEPSDGSIILFHGNGNEPRGIERLDEWLDQHPDWELAPMHKFVVPGVGA